ncbi:DUF485 domain-containing protein [Metapseudomonas furukawaii]|jgi:uncharacterized membrane protein (DUF485 family)|uniref:DUF485 domain-containing protein n=1 Tax=Metapseudomonas furukawaii TaxID=1149133 RepID=UPI004045E679
MTESINERILRNPKFQVLVARRQRFAWSLTALIVGLYLAFILVIAFVPEWLGTPIRTGSPITWGIPVGIGLNLLAIALTGLYVYRANGEFDRINQDILEEVRQ